ncbi:MULTISPECIES: hypothetical protein [unclassified Paenibacillus]|uniref:hypothetical protein n=1 Tax=unclassified Paenibacillus TaxID=185978 RepID=UPI00362FBFAA
MGRKERDEDNKYIIFRRSSEHVSSKSRPELIQAIGVDGTKGYVRATDLETKRPQTPEEAISKQRSIAPGSVKEIKLYDVNGEKVIGSFNISLRPDDVKEFTKPADSKESTK